MFCYKDRSWCTAKDCANLKCDRNTRNKDVLIQMSSGLNMSVTLQA